MAGVYCSGDNASVSFLVLFRPDEGESRTVAHLQRSEFNALARPVQSTFIHLQSSTVDSFITTRLDVTFTMTESGGLSVVGRVPSAWRGPWTACSGHGAIALDVLAAAAALIVQ